MKTLNEKLSLLHTKINHTDEKVRIMIVGLGSVGLYLLDYLISTADPRLEIIVVGRNLSKMQSDVNIVRVAATLRRQMRATVHIEAGCDLDNIDEIAFVISKWQPDFIVNSSRVYSGLKYGSISWSNLRAYGIWTPLSVKYAKNIMMAYEQANSSAITINTSYSDAVIPWIKSTGLSSFDFGSGNLNHLIPRMKFHIAERYGIDNLNEIDITLATSHFHDVVISKEGHAEGQEILLDVKLKGETIKVKQDELLASCMISMPVDQKRNMMNASSNFDIIHSILTAIRERKCVKIHVPGVGGEIGGYPFIIDGRSAIRGYIDESVFPLETMKAKNQESIYLDGIYKIENGELFYTPELLEKVKTVFNVQLPGSVPLTQANEVADLIISSIIKPNMQ